jgi:hypothetical protein
MNKAAVCVHVHTAIRVATRVNSRPLFKGFLWVRGGSFLIVIEEKNLGGE